MPLAQVTRRYSRWLAVAALIVALVLAAFSSGRERHTLHAQFDAALNVAPGQQVLVAAVPVGKIERVTPRDGGARVTMTVTDGDVWPLPRGTVARLRWGGTISYANRYVELVPEGGGAGSLAEGAVIPRERTITPVEFDQIYGILDRPTRPQLSALIAELGRTLRSRQRALRSGLTNTPPAFDAATEVLDQVGGDREALATLLRSGARTATALASVDDELQALITRAAGTFEELAARRRATQASLDRLPQALRTTRVGLARLDRSIPGLDALVQDAAPGARAVRRLAPVLRRTTSRLETTSPLLGSALRQAREATPEIRSLLATASPFLPKASRALERFAPMASCVRPYAPEIAGMFGVWAGFTSRYDRNGHVVRAQVTTQPIPNGTTMSSQEAIAANPQLRMALPAAPGLSVGQPWFQPQCGATRAALDPAFDPERRR